jgi:3-deoxy-D-manno-octulosonate 8-phosphate phosphatase (KDO 8-P phosphatase)
MPAANPPSAPGPHGQLFHELKLLVLDVDGVLTDGTVIYGAGDEELKSFHTRDGAGLAIWRDAGLATTFITGRGGEAVRRRADELRIGRIWERVRDKDAAFDEMLAHYGVAARQVVAMGDDVMDLPLLRRAAFSAAPADAADDVRAAVQMVTAARGGHGAVRELVEHLLRATGRWPYGAPR